LSISLAIGLLLSALIGISLGLIGGGGSIITVPVLVYVVGVAPHEAVAMSLGVVGSTSLVGAMIHRRRGNLDLRTASWFGGSGILGAFFGSRLTYLVPGHILLLIFAGLMLVVATLMLSGRGRSGGSDHPANPIEAVIAGLGVGVLTGFLGVGGGFLIVPALMFFGRLEIRRAIGTSLAVIFINCVAGIIGHLRFGGFDVALAAMITVPAIGGAFVGTHLAVKSSPAALRKGFAFFVIAVALYLVANNVGALLG